ncbi:MAG TPA: PilC/PilY family type IV pilus protein, partial [Burkholderiaceae bacterium]
SGLSDPVQYSCQRNFAILATDGYWNDSFSGIGNVDAAAGVTRPSLDPSSNNPTLADVAFYYYHTDLRTTMTNNVPPSGTNIAIDDTAQHQHMTTFTIGMGLDGTLAYREDYKSSTSGDYYDIKQGTKNWPSVPTAGNTQETIDDLWHAAVNGRGTYFSAQDPGALEEGMRRALSSIESTTGSGAAAATSNLQPTTGDNFIYIATYRTQQWDGEMGSYTVSLSNGQISTTPTWQAGTLLNAKIGAAGDTDTRTIYTANGNARVLFTPTGLSAAQLALFDNTKLNQYADWTAAQRTAATSALMVNYIRGQNRHEDQDRDPSFGTYNRLYRDREKVLGDIIHSQPVYVKGPQNNFLDTGYDAYKTTQTARDGTLYAAANDGMLHAFDADTGQERWAYVPPMILGELWRLAGSNYSTNHRFFLDGPLAVSDANIGGWKTVMIGALGKGGRGYYALDITDPDNPLPLWNFTANENHNVGYTYGTPYITKLTNGTWVAVLTSGYNNTPEGAKYASADGKGYIFVLNLQTGAVIRTISTNVGTTGNPSGLAKINLKINSFDTDNTAVAAYGGDLYGNMWRFDLDAGTVRKVVDLGSNKPIMTAPELATIDLTVNAVYFGTGRYLGEDDLATTTVQTVYGVKDDGVTTVAGTSGLVAQSVSESGATRSITRNAVDWSTGYGWYFNLADTGERIAVDPQLYFGTLVLASVVPTASACQPGGYSWLYQ